MTNLSTPTRPVMRYHGGKWRLATWIISHFPAHRVYVEPFGGAASVLIRKPRSYAEVYNDLAGEIVNVFRVLRDPETAAQLERVIRLTPFARAEFALSYQPSADPIEQARRTIFRTFAGFGSAAFNSRHATGFRYAATRSSTTPAGDWAGYPDQIQRFATRLAGVVIENREAVQVIVAHDSPDTLIYADPPYVHATRASRQQKNYSHEMDNYQHAALAGVLKACKGMVIISGYRSQLYDDIYPDWHRFDRKTYADGANARVESLWLSPYTVSKIGMLFS